MAQVKKVRVKVGMVGQQKTITIAKSVADQWNVSDGQTVSAETAQEMVTRNASLILGYGKPKGPGRI